MSGKKSKKEASSGARRFGYIVTILVNIALIYIANNLSGWGLPWLKESFVQCLWAINLAFTVTIFTNFIFLFFDRRWFRHLMEGICNIFSFISGYIFWRVFPLELSANWAQFINVILILMLVFTLIAILSSMLKAVREYRRYEYR
jgi:hypothetical protein